MDAEYKRTFVYEGASHHIHLLLHEDNSTFALKAHDLGKVLQLDDVRTAAGAGMLDSEDELYHGDELYLLESAAYVVICRSNEPVMKAFLNWTRETLADIRKEQRSMLQRTACLAALVVREQDEGIHETLMQYPPGINLVYFAKVRRSHQQEQQVLVAIGSTQNIAESVQSLASRFGSARLFRVFVVDRHEGFAKYLCQHITILPYALNDDGACNGSNVYRMDEPEILKAIRAAERSVQKFGLIKTQEVSATGRGVTVNRGDKMQRYSEDGKQLLKTYAGCTAATRDPVLGGATAVSMRAAAKNKTVYKGFRWAALDRSKPDDTIQDIGETSRELLSMRSGLVAMLNLTKTRVMQVFCDQLAAAQDRQFKGSAAISTALSKGTTSGGHKFMMWSDVPEELKAEYLARRQLPQERASSLARAVECLDPTTMAVVQRYASINDVLLKHAISRRTLENAVKYNCIAVGFLWRFVEQPN